MILFCLCEYPIVLFFQVTDILAIQYFPVPIFPENLEIHSVLYAERIHASVEVLFQDPSWIEVLPLSP